MTDLTQLLRSEFPDVAISLGNSVFFKIDDAPRVVEFLRTRQLAITGFEGFRLAGQTLAPDLTLIAHLTKSTPGWSALVDYRADTAQRVLATWPREPEIVIEFGARSPEHTGSEEPRWA